MGEGIILNESSITQALHRLVAHLTSGNMEQAATDLRVLAFERLLRPAKDPSKGPTQFIDPAKPFGSERVHETGDHLANCSLAIDHGDRDIALREAQAAMTRWTRA